MPLAQCNQLRYPKKVPCVRIMTVPVPWAPSRSLIFVKLHWCEFDGFRPGQKCTEIKTQKMPRPSCRSRRGKTAAQGHEPSSGPWLNKQEKSGKVPRAADGLCSIFQLLFKVAVASSKLPETLECIRIHLWATDVLTDDFGCITNILESFTIRLIIQ